jgi:hypothetical protein
LSRASNGHAVRRRTSARPRPAETGAQPSPAPSRSNATARGPPLTGKPSPPCAPERHPPHPRRQGLAQVPGRAYPCGADHPSQRVPCTMGAPPVVAGCATTRVASRALKDSIADLIAAGKIELQCSTCLPKPWPDRAQTGLGRSQTFSRPFRRSARGKSPCGGGSWPALRGRRPALRGRRDEG